MRGVVRVYARFGRLHTGTAVATICMRLMCYTKSAPPSTTLGRNKFTLRGVVDTMQARSTYGCSDDRRRLRILAPYAH